MSEWEEIYGSPIPEDPTESSFHEVVEGAIEEMEFLDDEILELIDECCIGIPNLNW